ncbi:FMN-dependent oxidoreductase (nitrilotriacetate monooxygenase family) [Bradyrhizobium elkanii]
MTRQMALVGFLQAQNCTNLPGSWRHPESRDDSMSADYYQEIARILERGKFHMAFFDDRLAMPDRYGNDHAHTVEYGIRCVKMDPIVVLTTMGMVTTKLGLASTASTTYFEPFDVARRFATLDLMTGGRAAWNVVTSVNDGEALNMGREQHLEHDHRYDRADEFMEVVLGHWDAWEDGSLLIDKKSGRFADPSKVKRLDHKGAFFTSRGPFTVPRSPQGHPVVIQAGASGRGQRFAGRWGEVIFTAARNLANAKQGYDAIRGEAAKAGRDPDQMFLCNLITPVTGATKAEAEDRMAVIQKLPLEIDALSLLAEGLNFDFGAKPIDEPLTSEELQGMQGMLGIRDGVLRTSGKSNPSTRDFITFSAAAARCRTRWSAARRRSPTGWRRCLSIAAATASSSRRATCRAPMPTSSTTWYPSCRSAGCSTRTTPARRCAKISGSSAPPRAPGRPARRPRNRGTSSCAG